ncbi:hypothetical protein C8N43_3543 [Litoreibacter ponti]|uniref:DUF2332 family protein n=1 Tax=Litoreibacter ponti TaxID=1510457 RepID=A0A2T6BF82_9RHOB|nr:DUF2332 family protein [Litoreibacter ponti]PTX54723.1 hypothetical protein C8N43_3543 [Litoreibacter ponti]
MSRLAEALRDQAVHCEALGSPFMARLLGLLAERLTPEGAVRERLFAWEGDLSPQGHSVPLRLCGALHALKMRDPDGALAAVYPPNSASDDALWAAVDATFKDDEAFLMSFLDSPPQTNEVRRSVAIIPAAMVALSKFNLPLTLSELGASAGLNLNFDRYALSLNGTSFGAPDPALTLAPDWNGPLPPRREIRVIDRAGVDLNPLTGPDDPARLRAYLWPDQPERLALTDAALDLPTPDIHRGDAADWLEARLAQPWTGLHFLFHTIAWQYFPPDVQERCARAIATTGERATRDQPLAWFAMENDNGAAGRGAAMTLRLWPGALVFDLGRADFHGRWIDWTYEG